MNNFVFIANEAAYIRKDLISGTFVRNIRDEGQDPFYVVVLNAYYSSQGEYTYWQGTSKDEALAKLEELMALITS